MLLRIRQVIAAASEVTVFMGWFAYCKITVLLGMTITRYKAYRMTSNITIIAAKASYYRFGATTQAQITCTSTGTGLTVNVSVISTRGCSP